MCFVGEYDMPAFRNRGVRDCLFERSTIEKNIGLHAIFSRKFPMENPRAKSHHPCKPGEIKDSSVWHVLCEDVSKCKFTTRNAL